MKMMRSKNQSCSSKQEIVEILIIVGEDLISFGVPVYVSNVYYILRKDKFVTVTKKKTNHVFLRF